MFVEERHQYIINKLSKVNKVLVNELSDKFGVSKDLIRKDLQKLEKEGLLIRTYGGAISNKRIIPENEVSSRINANKELKSYLVKKAVTDIEDGQYIYLDISSTNLILAQEIINKKENVTIVTNMLDIINLCVNKNYKNIIAIGGKFKQKLNGFVGVSTIKMIETYRFDKAYIGTVGVDLLNNEIYTFDEEDGITKRTILERSNKNCVFLENEKFKQVANFNFAKVTDLDCIICEEGIHEEYLEELKDLEIQVIL